MQGTRVQYLALGRFHTEQISLCAPTTAEKARAPHSSALAWKIPWMEEPAHSSALAWRIPWMEEPGSCSPWGRWGLDTTERLHFHFSFSCIGEGNGKPLQCSCLENPRDRGAWWAAVYGVAQSQTRLKWLSSSSSPNYWAHVLESALQQEKPEQWEALAHLESGTCSLN